VEPFAPPAGTSITYQLVSRLDHQGLDRRIVKGRAAAAPWRASFCPAQPPIGERPEAGAGLGYGVGVKEALVGIMNGPPICPEGRWALVSPS
jgi:hypothetical protein